MKVNINGVWKEESVSLNSLPPVYRSKIVYCQTEASHSSYCIQAPSGLIENTICLIFNDDLITFYSSSTDKFDRMFGLGIVTKNLSGTLIISRYATVSGSSHNVTEINNLNSTELQGNNTVYVIPIGILQ